MSKWQSLGAAVVLLGAAVACATATTEGTPTGVGGTDASGGSGGDMVVTAGGGAVSTSNGGGTSVGGQLAFGGTSGMVSGGASSSGAGGLGSAAGGAHAGGGAGTSSGGSGTAGSGTAGSSSGAGCTGLKTWDGGNYMFTLKAGDEIQWKGKKYKAAMDITYPNTDCAPDAPATYCAGWFMAEGSC